MFAKLTRLSVLALAALLVLAQLAHAENLSCDKQPCTAEQLKALGDAAMVAHDYELARSHYLAAYDQSPTAPLLYNLARSNELLGNPAEALSYLRRFEQQATPELRAKVPQLSELREQLASRVVLVQINASVERANVWLNGTQVGTLPISEPFITPPGQTKLVVRAPKHTPFEQTFEASAGDLVTVNATLQPAPPTPAGDKEAQPADSAARQASVAVDSAAPAPAQTLGPVRIAAWSALGLGAAAGIVAALSAGNATAARDDICGGATVCRRDTSYDSDAHDSYNAWRTAFTVSSIVGLAALGASGALFWYSWEEEVASPALGAYITPSALGLAGRF